MRPKLAIIGASTGQKPLCEKARQLGVETFCFAHADGAVCKDIVDHFYPISILDVEQIVKVCRDNGIQGVASNASELTAEYSNLIAEKLGLVHTQYHAFLKIKDKEYVRQRTNSIAGLTPVLVSKGIPCQLIEATQRPFILKPNTGSAKRGVMFVDDDTKIDTAIIQSDEMYIAEQYVDGQEYSVESLSFKGEHHVIQITEKDCSGAPHFVELGHHQPGRISEENKEKVYEIIPKILASLGFDNGASHIEIKISENNEIYLIEVNPRGGGDFISNVLVSESSDFDYLKGIIDIALNRFEFKPVNNVSFCGIYFLTAQTKRLLPYFEKDYPWMLYKEKDNEQLIESKGNYDHNGYIIYKSINKIEI